MARKFIAALAATAGLAFASQANATVFTGTWNLTAYENADPGLVLQVSQISGNFNLDLTSDPIQNFDMFKIWTNETDVEWGEDTNWSAISLTFDFTAPENNNSPIFIDGGTHGYTFFGIVQGGELVWNNGGQAQLQWGLGEPGLLDPGRMTITVNGGEFNEGYFGLHEGKKHGLKVGAEFHWDNNPTFGAVPEPATWALMIGGFGMAGAMVRRRRALALA